MTAWNQDDGSTVALISRAYVAVAPALEQYRRLRHDVLDQGAAPNTVHRWPSVGPWADPHVLRAGAWLDLRAGPVTLTWPSRAPVHPARPALSTVVTDAFARRVPAAALPSGGRDATPTVLRLCAHATVPAPDQEDEAVRLLDALHVDGPPAGRPPLADLLAGWPTWDRERATGGGFVDYLPFLALVGGRAGWVVDQVLDRMLAAGAHGARVGRSRPDPRWGRLVERGAALGAARLADATRRGTGTLPPEDGLGDDGRSLALATDIAGAVDATDPRDVLGVRLGGAHGEGLDGRRRHHLVLPAQMLTGPWSLTVYTEPAGEVFVAPDRVGLTGAAVGLRRSPDGSVRVTVQHHRPVTATDRANWLPAPEGRYAVVLRRYRPEASTREDPPLLHEPAVLGC